MRKSFLALIGVAFMALALAGCHCCKEKCDYHHKETTTSTTTTVQ